MKGVYTFENYYFKTNLTQSYRKKFCPLTLYNFFKHLLSENCRLLQDEQETQNCKERNQEDLLHITICTNKGSINTPIVEQTPIKKDLFQNNNFSYADKLS